MPARSRPESTLATDRPADDGGPRPSPTTHGVARSVRSGAAAFAVDRPAHARSSSASRTDEPTGRSSQTPLAHGELRVTVERRGAGVCLTRLAGRPPLQAMRLLAPPAAELDANLTIAALGPGMLGGDVADVQVSIGPSVRLHVTTVAATRVLPGSIEDPTRVENVLAVGVDGYLEWLPAPTILQRDAVLRQRSRLSLADGAVALIGEVIVPGRLAMGECWRFRLLDIGLTVLDSGGETLMVDRLRLDAGSAADGHCSLARPGLPDDAAAVLGTLYVLAPGRSLESLTAGLRKIEPAVGTTRLPNGAGILLRVAGPHAGAVLEALAPAVELVRAGLPQGSPISGPGKNSPKFR